MDARAQLSILADACRRKFVDTLAANGQYPMKATGVDVLQMNIRRKCNLFCKHCHVEAGPHRTEMMSKSLMGNCLEHLQKNDSLSDYMIELINSFNSAAAGNVMCKSTISVSYDGQLYDCDFNQMLELPIETNTHIREFEVHPTNACFSTCDIPVSSSGRAIFAIEIAIGIAIGLFPIPGVPFSVEIAFCLERIRFSIVLFYSDPDSDFDSDSDEDIGLVLVLR